MNLNLNEKSYDTVLTEASEFFQAQGLNIIGEGYKEIATNPALFESYVENLTEGASADHAAAMAQLMANTNTGILKESSMTGIQPIASLSMPVIRKLWPKFALKEALTTEVAKSPRFVVSYTKPYMTNGEEKVELVKGLHGVLKDNDAKSADSLLHKALKKNYTADACAKEESGIKVGGVTNGAEAALGEIADGAATVVDFSGDKHVTIEDTPSHIKKQPIDEVIVKAKTDDGVINTAKRLSVNGTVSYEIFDGAGAHKGELLVRLDSAAAKVTLVAIGAAVTVTSLIAGVSSEYNEESWSVGFDIARQDIDIPTGEHINAPLPIEALNDMMALYQIDGTKETVDIMTNIFAMKLDLEILEFIQTCLANRPQNEAFRGYKGASDDGIVLSFDCKPAAGFAGSPKAWREELKPLIDYVAQSIKNDTYLQAGVFTIVGNPLDIQILANVDWQFRGGQGGNIDGVDVDYSIGTYVGANAYKVVSSTLVPQGALYILFAPSGNTQMTTKYYPYTFSTEMGYVDPNRSRVPSIMMTKRHTMYEFMPAIGAVVISNNDGKWFNEYVSTKAHA